MDEPSVLDYVVAKLAFWRKSSLHLPPPEKEGPAAALDETAARIETLESESEGGNPESSVHSWNACTPEPG